MYMPCIQTGRNVVLAREPSAKGCDSDELTAELARCTALDSRAVVYPHSVHQGVLVSCTEMWATGHRTSAIDKPSYCVHGTTIAPHRIDRPPSLLLYSFVKHTFRASCARAYLSEAKAARVRDACRQSTAFRD